VPGARPSEQRRSRRRERQAKRYGLPVAPGKLITIEGLDGAGKSTLALALADAIAGRGVRVELLREPGGVALAERIRELLKDPSLEHRPSARAEALLYAAARAELTLAKLAPLLADGTWVLLDRFLDSSLAYQGGGRELGVEQVRALNLFATGGLVPDRTLFLRVSSHAGRARQEERALQPDPMELEDEGFFERVAATYEALARNDPRRIRQIDADRDVSDVRRQAFEAIEDLLPAEAGS
jgi:dTMP kinase